MQLKHTAIAGTQESSDVLVTVEPGGSGIRLELSSSVLSQFGKQIKAAVLETLQELEVTDARVIVSDQGALDCTIRARVQCAVYRAADKTTDIPWGGNAR